MTATPTPEPETRPERRPTPPAPSPEIGKTEVDPVAQEEAAQDRAEDGGYT